MWFSMLIMHITSKIVDDLINKYENESESEHQSRKLCERLRSLHFQLLVTRSFSKAAQNKVVSCMSVTYFVCACLQK